MRLILSLYTFENSSTLPRGPLNYYNIYLFLTIDIFTLEILLLVALLFAFYLIIYFFFNRFKRIESRLYGFVKFQKSVLPQCRWGRDEKMNNS